MAFSPDGRQLTCVNGKGDVQIWDAATAKELFDIVLRMDGLEGFATEWANALKMTLGDITAMPARTLRLVAVIYAAVAFVGGFALFTRVQHEFVEQV